MVLIQIKKYAADRLKEAQVTNPVCAESPTLHFFINLHAPTSDQTAAEITTRPLSEPNMSECVRFSFGALIFVLWHLLNDRLSFHLTLVEAGANGTGTCTPTTHKTHVHKTRAWVCLQWAETTENTVWLDSTPQPPEYLCECVCVCVCVCAGIHNWESVYVRMSLASMCLYEYLGTVLCVCVRRSVVTYSCDVDHQHPLLWMRRINKPRCSLLAVWYWSQMHVNRA